MIKKYLLLGSAPYVVDWFAEHGQKYIDDGHVLCALNNAWQAVPHPEQIGIWFRSEDYFAIKNSKTPDDKLRGHWTEIVEMQTFPFYYTKIGGTGTISANVICHLMNQEYKNGNQLWLALAGCDMMYRGKNDWFYGKGKPDPMRLGKERLVEIMTMLKQLCEQAGGSIVNVGGQDETLLPFARFDIDARK